MRIAVVFATTRCLTKFGGMCPRQVNSARPMVTRERLWNTVSRVVGKHAMMTLMHTHMHDLGTPPLFMLLSISVILPNSVKLCQTSPFLTLLFSRSLTSSCFRSNFKNAVVRPLLKREAPDPSLLSLDRQKQ